MSFTDGLFKNDSIPAIEQVMRFVGLRHRQIVNNIANVDTPDYRPQDLPVGEFQAALKRALDARGAGPGGAHAGLPPLASRNIRAGGGTFRMQPVRSASEGPMRHDGNTVSIEAEMSNLAKNALTGRIFTRLLVNRFQALRTAIRGRM